MTHPISADLLYLLPSTAAAHGMYVGQHHDIMFHPFLIHLPPARSDFECPSTRVASQRALILRGPSRVAAQLCGLRLDVGDASNASYPLVGLRQQRVYNMSILSSQQHPASRQFPIPISFHHGPYNSRNHSQTSGEFHLDRHVQRVTAGTVSPSLTRRVRQRTARSTGGRLYGRPRHVAHTSALHQPHHATRMYRTAAPQLVVHTVVCCCV